MKPELTASAKHIQAHLDALCADIGNRLAASDNERLGAEYVGDYLQSLGLSGVALEDFPYEEWGYDTCEVAWKTSSGWSEIETIPVASSQPTPADGVAGRLVCVDNALPADLARQDVRDKILLIWGPHGGDSSKLAALNECGAAGILWVDDRLPFDWPVSIGTPYDWRNICQLPQVCVAYTDAWELHALVSAGASVRVRMRSDLWSKPKPSVNVFGDLPGSGDEFVHVGGHLDSVVVGTGADDDASGVAVTLEVARLLGQIDATPLRTVRFIGYGAEEQLSEGARRYVAAHRDEVDRTRLCIQLDSVGSIAGRNECRVVGPPELTSHVRELVGLPELGAVPADVPEGCGYSCSVIEEVSPYSDMFPYNIHGAPSLWLYRTNMPGMRFFHHAELDDLPVVSAHEIARCATATARLAYAAAFTDPPYARAIPEPFAGQIEEMSKRFFE